MNHVVKGALAAAVLAIAAVPALVFAEGGPYATFDIKLEQNPAVSDVSPVVSEPITKDHVAFHIINNTGKAAYFNGAQGEYIPLVSNSTVTVPYKAGDQYSVVDSEGKTIAKWNLEMDNKGSVPNVASASSAQFSEWGNTLQQVISNQKVAYQEPASKPEPRYYEYHSKNTASKSVIRGYW